MIKYIFTVFLYLLTITFPVAAQTEPTRDELLKEITATVVKSDFQKSATAFWQDKLKEERYASDVVVRAKINYMIARSFASQNMDSAEVYVTKALMLVENIEGYENVKLSIYNGLGNIAQLKGKIFLASFYYNKTISILDVNPFVDVPNESKIQYYLHSGQANIKIGLYESAFELNKKAEKFLSPAIKENYLWFRVYSQLFASGYQRGVNTDSLEIYLEKVEKYSDTEVAKRFYYEHKAKFFELTKQLDSAKVYFEKVVEFEKNKYLDEPNSTIIGNIYIGYCHLLENSVDRKQLTEAKSLINQLQDLEKYNYHLQVTDSIPFWSAMATYYYETKDFEKYKKAKNKVIDLQTITQRKSELQAKEEMQSMYQLKENQKSITMLSRSVKVKENQLQTTQSMLIIVTLLIIVILSSMAVLYYRQKNQKLQQEYRQVVLEQKLLRTQMEPHFIFNTLSTLQSMIRFQDSKKAINYLNYFSRLLRSNLELSRQETISLEDELETLETYFKLQQTRFQDKFEYHINVNEEVETGAIFIPPMLIQPFAENSILHGFKGESKEWKVQIVIRELVEKNQLEIEIIDNGIGIEEIRETKKKSFSGAITKERLQILSKKHNTPTDYQIVSEKGKGTKVLMKLPIIGK
ncbi:histidine kinase [Bernardetia sp. ABR2-2B]|uniref:tetratricopeptide repeat-containing sensor histidine kinase n=1 Tax=Bernardetia sp. ABR2-2B TaxID=3127472 RepID=UPI0030D323A5